MSSNDDICTGSFYPFDGGGDNTNNIGDGIGGHNTNHSAGVVRVVIPNDTSSDEGNSKFVSFHPLGALIHRCFVVIGIMVSCSMCVRCIC